MTDETLQQSVQRRRNEAVSASVTLAHPDPTAAAIQGVGINLAAIWDALDEIAAAVDQGGAG
ncbi:MAG: hypothetical protein WD598_10025 [Acidimicrobiia bacterium]